MAISAGSTITYGDLISQTTPTLYSMADNLNTSSFPSNITNGYSTVVSSTRVAKSGTDNGYKGHGADNRNFIGKYYTRTTTRYISDSYLNYRSVSSSTIYSKFSSFLSSNGVASGNGTIVTVKGLLNYANVVASFIRTYYVVIRGDSTRVYFDVNRSATTGTSQTAVPTAGKVMYASQAVQQVNNALNASKSSYSVTYHTSTSSCSSSSSSSSSSCSSSSSSSSSSSVFIAYMKL